MDRVVNGLQRKLSGSDWEDVTDAAPKLTSIPAHNLPACLVQYRCLRLLEMTSRERFLCPYSLEAIEERQRLLRGEILTGLKGLVVVFGSQATAAA